MQEKIIFLQILLKYGQISLIKFAELKEAEVITTKLKQGTYQKYKNIVEVDEA